MVCWRAGRSLAPPRSSAKRWLSCFRNSGKVAEIFERASGRQAKKRHVPLPVMRAVSILMQPVNPALSRLIRLGIFMDTANLCYDMTETARAFGVQLTPLEEIARRAITSAGSASSDEQDRVGASRERSPANE